jgi:two-component system chemotaxis response regulator CheB
MVRVLIADSTAAERGWLGELIRSDPDLTVVGEAGRAGEAIELARRLRPDIILIGARLPGGGGFEATKEIMIEAPTPIVIVTDPPEAGHVTEALQALRVGALTVLPRPSRALGTDATPEFRRFVSSVKAMAQVRVVRRWRDSATVPQRREAEPFRVSAIGKARIASGTEIRAVAIGASTGGPAALQRILGDLPPNFGPPILIVQHISKGFIAGLIQWLSSISPLPVKVAGQGEPLTRSTIYIAPDDRHLGVTGESRIQLSDAAPIGGFRPSATFLFESVARAFGGASLHVILTGMGRDGVAGLEVAHSAGALVIAQDEASSVIFGMPGAAVAAGIVDRVVPLDNIAQDILAVAAPNLPAV